MADANIVFNYDVWQHDRVANNARRRHLARFDPRESMSDREIFENFRFNKENIQKIIDLFRYKKVIYFSIK